MHSNIEKKLYMFSMLFVLIVAANAGGREVLAVEPLQRLNNMLNFNAKRLLFIAAGLGALYLIMKRDVYLPFLGDSACPCAVFVEQHPVDYTDTVTVTVKPNSKVVYWASESADGNGTVANPYTAYDDYKNSGVVVADADGKAELKVRQPSSYKAGFGKQGPHIHYRYCENAGMLSEVHTAKL